MQGGKVLVDGVAEGQAVCVVDFTRHPAVLHEWIDAVPGSPQ